jgi:hypothetical protein
MIRRTLISAMVLGALAATPTTAAAYDEPLVAPAAGQALTALDGNVVWISSRSYPDQTLMRRTPDGAIAPVIGARPASYHSIDLGRDEAGRLALTYVRCSNDAHCAAYSDDLAGHRVRFEHLVPKRCTLTSVPARWGTRIAFGLSCDHLHGVPDVYDGSRSGLFTKRGTEPARRLRMPKDADQYVQFVDIRGTTVGALAPTYGNLFAETVNGTHLRSARVGDPQAHNGFFVGMALGSGGTAWAVHTDLGLGSGPAPALLSRLSADGCVQSQHLATKNLYGATVSTTAMAVDAGTLYLSIPDSGAEAGIVTQAFAPETAC